MMAGPVDELLPVAAGGLGIAVLSVLGTHTMKGRFGTDRRGCGIEGAVFGIWTNLLLSAFKVWAGLVSGSFAVLADAIHSLSDVLTSAVVVAGIHVSGREPDRDHPLGHGDAEPIAGLIVSILLVVVGVEFARTAVERLLKPDIPQVTVVAIAATLVALAYKWWVTLWVKDVVEKVHSPALKADAEHHASDVLSSVVVLVGVTGSYIGYPRLDWAAGLIVSAWVCWVGFSVGRSNIRMLMGTVEDPTVRQRIKDLALAEDDVKNVHRVLIHYTGLEFSVTLHLRFKRDMLLSEAHEIARRIEDTILDDCAECKYVTVHMDPAR